MTVIIQVFKCFAYICEHGMACLRLLFLFFEVFKRIVASNDVVKVDYKPI